ncbi:MAG TPA: prohibitin family protein [Phycisphaerae bacterium]|nr:prohibitin family protein [Phycisphaerae bacterium]
MQLLIIAIILAVVGIALLVQHKSYALRNMPKVLPPALFVVAVLMLLGSTIVIIPAGHVGVPVLFGKVQNRSLPEGLHVINPLLNVVKMSVRTQVYTMSIVSQEGQKSGDDSITVLSRDGLRMPLDITVAYRLISSDAPSVYRTLGEDYAEKIIRPASRTAIREAASQFTAQEAYSTKRTELATQTQEGLIERIKSLMAEQENFKGQGFVIQQVMLRNVSLPERLRRAIEEKLSMEQDAQRMEFVLAKAHKQAEQRKIDAEGKSEANRILNASLTDKILLQRGIEATMSIAESNNAKVVIIGGGKDGLPVILNVEK